jgi:hypothetical protein
MIHGNENGSVHLFLRFRLCLSLGISPELNRVDEEMVTVAGAVLCHAP